MTFSPFNIDEFYMHRCLELASSGIANVMPNPMVGCIIVHQGKIIGEGFHQQFGKEHAEVNAINSVKDKSLLKKATLYVNLEPCAHFGKTPPCSDRITEERIPSVVIGCKDPNPETAGKGIEKLKSENIVVHTGILEEESRWLNRRFFCFHNKKRPYIILKWAQTQDGFIADKNKNSKWISNSFSRMLVHKWRSEEMAIMVGANTALNDNPQLTTRNWTGKNPLRILIDKELSTPPSLHLYNDEYGTIIVNNRKDAKEKNLEFVKINFSNFLPELMNFLYKKDIQSVIVEGGKQLLDSFIEKRLWDEARIFQGNGFFLGGLEAPKLNVKASNETYINGDKLSYYYNLHK